MTKIFRNFLPYLLIIICFFLVTPKSFADTQTLFTDDGESGSSNWTTTGNIGSSSATLWHLSQRSYSSPTHAWYYGQEDTGNYDTGSRNSGYLISKSITVPSQVNSVTLQFRQLLQTENSASSSGSIYYDAAKVEVSTDGVNWNTLGTFRSSANGWETVGTAIPSYYLGSSIQIRFSFDTIDGIANNYEGWYVDDVAITADIPATPTPTPTNQPPVANPGGPYTAVEDQPVTFNASASYDPDGDPITGYAWYFDYANQPNNITFIPIPSISHTYTKGGTYTVGLTVQDNFLQSPLTFTTVNVQEVNDAPVANAGSDKITYTNQSVSFDGSASTDEEGPVTYSWNFGDGTTGNGVAPTHTYTHSGSYTVTLTVTDTGNLTSQDTLTVTVNNDVVSISKAIYIQSKKQLLVEATSNLSGTAILTLQNYGQMTYQPVENLYRYIKDNTVNPGSVTVTSSHGGSATLQVTKQAK